MRRAAGAAACAARRAPGCARARASSRRDAAPIPARRAGDERGCAGGRTRQAHGSEAARGGYTLAPAMSSKGTLGMVAAAARRRAGGVGGPAGGALHRAARGCRGPVRLPRRDAPAVPALPGLQVVHPPRRPAVPALRLPPRAEAVEMKRLVVAIALIAGAALSVATTGGADPVPLSISIVGNHFVNGSGQTIRLLGVDRAGDRVRLPDGYGYSTRPRRRPRRRDRLLARERGPDPAERGLLARDQHSPVFRCTATGYRSIEDYVADSMQTASTRSSTCTGQRRDTGIDGQRAMPDDPRSRSGPRSPACSRQPCGRVRRLQRAVLPWGDGNYPFHHWSCWENGTRAARA